MQKHIGGELNYLFSKMWLDIAFEEDRIYVEYDGSGHNIDVQYGYLTQDEFNQKEMKRYFFLKNQEWKQIRIISEKDLIPCQKVLRNLMSYSKKVLETNNWIEFNLDDSQIITKNQIVHFDFKAKVLNSKQRKSVEK